MAFEISDNVIWVDSEVHLLPPEWCQSNYYPPAEEAVMRRIIYDHPEREMALSRASVAGLLAEMEKAGVDKAIIMGMPWQNPAFCWKNNDYIAEVVERYPQKFIGLGILPHPQRDDPVLAVERIAEEYGFKGTKVIPSWYGYGLNDSEFESVLTRMITLNLVLVPHTDQLFVDPQKADSPYRLLQVARKFPELKILAPHLGGLLCLYALHPPIKGALKNILFVTSLPSTMKMVAFAVQSVGAGQVAFGTDFPFNAPHDQATVRRELEALSFSEQELSLIAGKNILQFLELEE